MNPSRQIFPVLITGGACAQSRRIVEDRKKRVLFMMLHGKTDWTRFSCLTEGKDFYISYTR